MSIKKLWQRGARPPHPAIPDNPPPLFPATFLLLALLICTAGYFSYEYLKRDVLRQSERTLANLAEMKVGQIDSWIEERRTDAIVLSRGSYLSVLMDEWLSTGTLDEKRKQWMLARLGGMLNVNQFDEVMLLDIRGIPCLSTSGIPDGRDDGLQQFALKSMAERRVILSDLHWGIKGKPELDLVAPLLVGEDKNGRVVGAIYFHIDPALFLLPLIQARPLASDTAETLLVRQEGDEVLFLSELRHRPGNIMTLRLPLADSQLPAAKAARGETGLKSGKDYRGEAVLSYLLPINHLSWKMSTKIDENEIFAPVRRLALVVSALTLLLTFLAALVLRARQKHLEDAARHYKLQLEGQTLASRFNFLSEFANDIILLTDERGQILDANMRAVETYGYTHEEFLKMSAHEIRPLDQRAAFAEVFENALKQDSMVGEALHQRKDGSTFPVEFSVRRFVSDDHTYFQSILRDITERKQAEMALRGQKEFLRRVIDADPNRILVTDAEGRYTLVNKAMADAYRMTPEEMLGRSRFELNSASEAALFHKLDQKVIETRRQTVAIVPSSANNDQERWFLSIKVPLEQPDGTTLVLGISVDITESKRTEDKLRHSEALFRTLVEHLPHKIFMKGEDSFYTFCNTPYAEELGISPDDIVGKTDKDFYPKHMAAKFMKNDLRIITSGEMVDAEESYLHNGQEKIVHALKIPIKDECGKGTGILGVFLDITERRITERALLEAEQRYRVWLDVAPVACIIWNPETYAVMEWNRMAEAIFGWKREEVLERNFLELMVPQEALEEFQSAMMFPLWMGIASHSINQNLTSGGGSITCEWYNVGLKSHDGHTYATMSMCSDITERTQIAALLNQHKNEMKHVERLKVAGEMASGLAHELSQPLSAANNYLDACLRRLQRGEVDPDWQSRHLGLAYKQTERARKIINHFKLLIHREEYPRASLDVNQVVRAAANFLEEEVRRFDIDLKMDLAPLPEFVANNVELEQVIFNLIKNAIEAMQDCPVRRLRLSSRRENDTILVEVGDSGKGIPGDELELIFNQFHTTKRDGLGLGLAICRTIIIAHEGRIWVSSTPGTGSTFHIALPVGNTPAPDMVASARDAAPACAQNG